MWCEWRVLKNPSTGTEGEFWKLIRFESNGDATWVKISEATTGPVITLSDDAATKVESDATGNIQIEGTAAQVTVTADTGNNKLVLSLPGGTPINSFTVPAGTSPVVPDANGLVTYTESGATTITGGTNTMDFNSINCAAYIVDATAADGNYTTIASAITAASSGDTIFVRPGTYTEDLTLKAGVNICSFPCEAGIFASANVSVVGKLTVNMSGNVSISGISFTTNSDYIIEATGSSSSILVFTNCRFQATDNDGMSMNSSSLTTIFRSCQLVASATFALATLTTGIVSCRHSSVASVDSTPITLATSFQLYFCTINNAFTSSGTGAMTVRHCSWGDNGNNAVLLTTVGTGSHNITESQLSSGSASNLSIGTGTTVNITNCQIKSSATNIFTGLGTVNTGGNVALNSSGNNVSTINTLTTI
jgi:hypothetical protein